MPRSEEFPWLAALGLKACQIRGDGNCLFNALSDQLYGNQSRNVEIRQAVVKYMGENPDYFKPFIVVDGPRRNPKRKVTRGSSSQIGGATENQTERTWEKYLKQMERSGTYGDHTEIQAFTKAYEIDVQVFESATITYHIRPHDDHAVRPVIYIAHHNWEHFSSVRNINDSGMSLPEIQPKHLSADEDFSSNPPSPGSYSQSGSSSIERDPDSDDDEYNGPNKRRDRRLSRASRVSYKNNSSTTTIDDQQAIPTIELTEPDSKISSQLPTQSQLPSLSTLPAKSEIPGLSMDVQEFNWAPSDNDSEGDSKVGEENDAASSYSASSRAGSVSFDTAPPQRITIKLNTRSRINAIKSVPQKKLTARDLKSLKKAAQKQARKESKRNNIQPQLATSTTSINRNRNCDSPPMEQVMGMKTLYI